MRAHPLILISIALATPMALDAQTFPEPGDRIRVTRTDGGVLEGDLLQLSPYSLQLLATRRGPAIWIPRTAIQSLETSLGRHHRLGRNFLATLSATALVGGVWTAVTYEPCTGFCILAPESTGEAFGFGFIGGAVLGIPVGMIVALVVRHERWSPLEGEASDTGRLSVQPVPGSRPGIAFSFRPGW